MEDVIGAMSEYQTQLSHLMLFAQSIGIGFLIGLETGAPQQGHRWRTHVRLPAVTSCPLHWWYCPIESVPVNEWLSHSHQGDEL
jgi:hypothetical protein